MSEDTRTLEQRRADAKDQIRHSNRILDMVRGKRGKRYDEIRATCMNGIRHAERTLDSLTDAPKRAARITTGLAIVATAASLFTTAGYAKPARDYPHAPQSFVQGCTITHAWEDGTEMRYCPEQDITIVSDMDGLGPYCPRTDKAFGHGRYHTVEVAKQAQQDCKAEIKNNR